MTTAEQLKRFRKLARKKGLILRRDRWRTGDELVYCERELYSGAESLEGIEKQSSC
ncbi:MAG: hypothetical protein ACLPXW_15300 [Xanthobacteraceae bacterium]